MNLEKFSCSTNRKKRMIIEESLFIAVKFILYRNEYADTQTKPFSW